MKFDDETTDVLIGGYMSKDAAQQDYEAVLHSGGYLHGAAIVGKDLDGELSVEQTDHMVREGAAGLGAVGFAVGLFAPPLLAATAVGAVIGAGVGRLLHHKTEHTLEEKAGATIPLGGAGLIVAYPRSAAEKVEPAVTRAVQKVVGQAEGHHVQALKGAIADAEQKMADSSSDDPGKD
jgi:arylsulfatase